MREGVALGTLSQWLGILLMGSASACTEGRPDRPTSVLTQSLEAPAISDEFELNHPVYEYATGYDVRVASGAPGYLALSIIADDPAKVFGTDFIMATRILPDGAVLDQHGLYLGTGTRALGQYAFDHWVVLRYDAGELFCTQLRDDGSEVEPGGTSLGELNAPAAVAYDGSAMLVLGQEGQAFLLAPDCTRLTAPVAVAELPVGYFRPALAFDGVSYLVTYSTCALGQPDRLVLQKISTAGEVIGAPLELATATWTRDTADTEGYQGVAGLLASEGGKTLIAYSYATWSSVSRTAPIDSTHYRLLDADGSLGVDHPLGSKVLVNLRTAGDGFTLGIRSPGALVKLGLDAETQATLTDFSWSGPYEIPGVTHRGTDLLLYSSSQIRRYDSAFSPSSDPAPFIFRASDSTRPKVATAGDVRLVLSGSDEVYASRVSKDGTSFSERRVARYRSNRRGHVFGRAARPPAGRLRRLGLRGRLRRRSVRTDQGRLDR